MRVFVTKVLDKNGYPIRHDMWNKIANVKEVINGLNVDIEIYLEDGTFCKLIYDIKEKFKVGHQIVIRTAFDSTYYLNEVLN